MKNKIIGISIIGTVLSLAIAYLTIFGIQMYNNSSKIYSQKIINPIISYTLKYEYHLSKEGIFSMVAFIGLLLTVIVIQTKSGTKDVYRFMTYSIFATSIIGAILGCIYATRFEIKSWDYTLVTLTHAKEYFINSLYIGLGIAALIIGVHLTNKKPST